MMPPSCTFWNFLAFRLFPHTLIRSRFEPRLH